MGLYRQHVLPRIVDKACATKEITPLRARATEGLAGRVVEIGFGSGLNLPHLPAAVDELLAVEPSTTARRLAAGRIGDSPVPVEVIGLDGEHLPLDDDSVDAALSTFTLCTIPDAVGALRELRRVLRPGGNLHFLEHGLSPDPIVARWQHRLTPIQRRLFGGCHFDRPIDQLLTTAGFEISSLRNYHLRGPKTPGYMYEGTAHNTPAAVR
jgi:ubiquinone/menaquinone biosynthesis C-methylase UbiE